MALLKGSPPIKWVCGVFARVATILVVVVCLVHQPAAASEPMGEYEVKAGFLYNFLLFSEWPTSDSPDQSREKIRIGIMGSDPFGDAFVPVNGREVQGRTLEVIKLPPTAPRGELLRCDLLFIALESRPASDRVIAMLEGLPVLTVGDREGFAESGGMIGFVMDDARVRFEVNTAAASRSGIRFRSRLLRLALRVVE